MASDDSQNWSFLSCLDGERYLCNLHVAYMLPWWRLKKGISCFHFFWKELYSWKIWKLARSLPCWVEDFWGVMEDGGKLGGTHEHVCMHYWKKSLYGFSFSMEFMQMAFRRPVIVTEARALQKCDWFPEVDNCLYSSEIGRRFEFSIRVGDCTSLPVCTIYTIGCLTRGGFALCRSQSLRQHLQPSVICFEGAAPLLGLAQS